MGIHEREHQQRLLAEHERRLAELEIRQAREGYDTPTDVITEIAQINASVARLRDALQAPLPRETVRALDPDDRYQGHVAWQMRMEEAVYEFRKEVQELRRVVYGFGAVLLVVTTIVAMRAFG